MVKIAGIISGLMVGMILPSTLSAQTINRRSDVWTKGYKDASSEKWAEGLEHVSKLYNPDAQAYAAIPAIPGSYDPNDTQDAVKEAKAVAEYIEGVAATQADGLRVMARLQWDYQEWEINEYILAQGENIEDHSVILLDGSVAIFPWNGNQRFCSNSPVARAAMKKRVKVAVDAGVDLVSVDLQRNTVNNVKRASCFCRHCEVGFRAFLKSKYSNSELSRMGIPDITRFEYRAHLLKDGWTIERFVQEDRQKGPDASIPFFNDFLIYQYQEINAFHKELADYADAYAGRSVPFLSSSDPLQVRQTTYIKEVDGYITEGDQLLKGDNLELYNEVLLLYKICEVVGKPNLITAGPRPWRMIRDKKAESLARAWIAQSYAYGSNFLAPIKQWTNPGQYDPNPQEFRYLFKFIQDNRSLFDGYDSFAKIGLIYSHLGSRYGKEVALSAVDKLTAENIPFEFLFFGDDLYSRDIDRGRLDELDAIILTEDFKYLDPPLQAEIKSRGEKVISIEHIDRLWDLIKRPIDVSVGNDNVTIVARRANDGGLVLHMLGRPLNPPKPAPVYKDFNLEVSEAFSGPFESATLHAPNRKPVRLTVYKKAGVNRIRIPRLYEWAIVDLNKR